MSLSHHAGLGAIAVHRQHLRVVPQDRAGARQEDRGHQVGPQEEQGIQLLVPLVVASVTFFMCDDTIMRSSQQRKINTITVVLLSICRATRDRVVLDLSMESRSRTEIFSIFPFLSFSRYSFFCIF